MQSEGGTTERFAFDAKVNKKFRDTSNYTNFLFAPHPLILFTKLSTDQNSRQFLSLFSSFFYIFCHSTCISKSEQAEI